MEYYLIPPEILKDLYEWNHTTKENINQIKKNITDTQERLLKNNVRMNEEMKKIVEQKIENQFHFLKRDLQETEENK